MNYLYVLKDPTSGDIRYVGKTTNLRKRSVSHVINVRREGNTHRANWIRQLLSKGLKPVMELLEEVEDAEWPALEVAYIQFFRDAGFDLVNTSLGGESGHQGCRHSAQTRAIMSQAHMGRPGRDMKGKNNPMFGRKVSQESRAKMSEKAKGQKRALGYRHSPETLEVLRNLKKGKPWTAARRAAQDLKYAA